MNMKLFKNRTTSPELDDALAAWRAGDQRDESLSPAARGRILGSLQARESHPGFLAPLASLFLPARRFAVAAGLPVLALTLFLGHAALSVNLDPVAGGSAATQLQVSKQGGEVVFRIANGGTPHRVYRSTEARSAVSEEFVVTRGSFRDSLESETNLVFYRVD